MKNKNLFNIPNFITLLRIVLAFLLSYFIINQQVKQALILLVIVIFSDFIDGFIARRYSKVTSFGAVFDPLADSVLILTILLSLLFLDFSLLAIIILLFLPRIITYLFIIYFGYYKYSATFYSKAMAVLTYLSLFALIAKFSLLVVYVILIPLYILLIINCFYLFKHGRK